MELLEALLLTMEEEREDSSTARACGSAAAEEDDFDDQGGDTEDDDAISSRRAKPDMLVALRPSIFEAQCYSQVMTVPATTFARRFSNPSVVSPQSPALHTP
jgi:hypothetical protein